MRLASIQRVFGLLLLLFSLTHLPPLAVSLLTADGAHQAFVQAFTFTVLLGSIAAISLLVGGIGVMNIMLVNVTERTREIGIRMAVGATRRDILVQFLVESIVLSITGGIVGLGLGAGVTSALASLAGWNVLLPPQAIGLALSFSIGVGIFFGLYPASKAARLDPIDALRYE